MTAKSIVADGGSLLERRMLWAIYSSGAIPISVRVEPQIFLRTDFTSPNVGHHHEEKRPHGIRMVIAPFRSEATGKSLRRRRWRRVLP
jgi:hypothetical protein